MGDDLFWLSWLLVQISLHDDVYGEDINYIKKFQCCSLISRRALYVDNRSFMFSSYRTMCHSYIIEICSVTHYNLIKQCIHWDNQCSRDET